MRKKFGGKGKEKIRTVAAGERLKESVRLFSLWI